MTFSIEPAFLKKIIALLKEKEGSYDIIAVK